MWDLTTRMKIGDLGMKQHTLWNLLEFMLEDEKYVKVTIDVDDVVHLLVGFLGSMRWKSKMRVLRWFLWLLGLILKKEFWLERDNACGVLAHGGVSALLKICGGVDRGGNYKGYTIST
ncbi:hypothetical protein VNO80_07025 [Phaseolus coccineus]|uniref:Uncharacterized protein n=1 Tax=Phaseolus coccineus TaxID=3886 RepID=A0AAN9RF06_PHACN